MVVVVRQPTVVIRLGRQPAVHALPRPGPQPGEGGLLFVIDLISSREGAGLRCGLALQGAGARPCFGEG